MLVAVYGTLKKGHYNHFLIENEEFVGTDLIENFNLYNLGFFPGIIPGDNKVFIEIYNIEDSEVLKNLDRLEGYPQMYDKKTVSTIFGHVIIYVYNYNIENKQLIESGFWTNLN